MKIPGPLGAFIAGALSGVVFSPCATPILIAILALIGTQGDFVFGIWLMFLYSLGNEQERAAGAMLAIFGIWLALGT